MSDQTIVIGPLGAIGGSTVALATIGSEPENVCPEAGESMEKCVEPKTVGALGCADGGAAGAAWLSTPRVEVPSMTTFSAPGAG